MNGASWNPSEGTFQTRSSMQPRLGDLIAEEAIPPGQGTFRMPEFQGDRQESMRIRTSNADRSIIWETTLKGLGISMSTIAAVGQTAEKNGIELRTEVDSQGRTHILESVAMNGTSPSAHMLAYRRLAADGVTMEVLHHYTKRCEDGSCQSDIRPSAMTLALDRNDIPYIFFYDRHLDNTKFWTAGTRSVAVKRSFDSVCRFMPVRPIMSLPWTSMAFDVISTFDATRPVVVSDICPCSTKRWVGSNESRSNR